MFRNHDCAGAAFFMGALCHYIADATYPQHLIPDHNAGTMRSNREQILKLTDQRYYEWPSDDGGPFFQIKEARKEFQTYRPKIKTSSIATYLAGFDAFYGEAYPSPPAAFRARSYETGRWINDRYFPTYAIPTRANLRQWTYDDWDNIPNANHKAFLNTTHHHLNVAVYYTAAVINYLKDSYTSCIFLDGEEQLLQLLREKQLDISVYMLLAVAGSWATFFSIATTLITKEMYLLISDNLLKILKI